MSAHPKLVTLACHESVPEHVRQILEEEVNAHLSTPENMAAIAEQLALKSADDKGIDVGDTTSGKVHVSIYHGEERLSIVIDPDHAQRIAERLWDCAATGRAVQSENNES